ncbi:MAG: hydantoinase/oxoprolinase family protein [Anaerolineaceae bacterium]|nr:MAG: hydantoinase/oxoprolinase family protein [Anaerolineaceae bacterium]
MDGAKEPDRFPCEDPHRIDFNEDNVRIGIDIGGTFTDFVFFDEELRAFYTYKVLSNPLNPAQPVLDGLEALDLKKPPSIIHGSTIATNALLERKGARTALISTYGFRDVIAIGRQVRSELYDFAAHRPQPLVPEELRLEIKERVDHRGNVITPLNEEGVKDLCESLKNLDAESVAVCLLFSFAYPTHEKTIARVFREADFFVSPSCEILPEFREYERTSTSVINAYVSPIVDRYLQQLKDRLEDVDFRMMQSNGGSIRASQIRKQAVRSILSGPAGGVVGAFHIAKIAGFENVIGFDMGGTSTDVSLCAGDIRITNEAEIDGFPIRIPMIDIHTVGSGGGSIAYVDAGGALRVGPQSAGADPGPVCYGLGGTEPTVTDANLVLGRLMPEYFLEGRMSLDSRSAQSALEDLAEQAGISAQSDLSRSQTAALGVIHVVNARMERALRVISVERGHDPKDFTLVSFGGAGGLHAAQLARALGIPRVLIPPTASTLSALGMLTADAVKDYVQTVMLPGTTAIEKLETLLEPLVDQCLDEFQQEGISKDRIILQKDLDIRYEGQGYELTVPLSAEFEQNFHDSHMQTYSHSSPDSPIEIVNVRLRGIGGVPRPPLPRAPLGTEDPEEAYLGQRPFVLIDGSVSPKPFYRGDQLKPGHVLRGPAIVVYKDTTVFLPVGDRARVDEFFNLVVEIGSET